MTTNDNNPPAPAEAPAVNGSGRAALLLVESLIHGLCERSTLTAAEAVDIVDRAAEVQGELAEQADGAAATMWHSHALLCAIATSLRTRTIPQTTRPPTL